MSTPSDLPRLSSTTHIQVVVTSFGYGHAPAPEANITIDARRHLRNPHEDPAMRTLTGLNDRVRAHVRDTPGASWLVANTALMARGLLDSVADARQHLVTVATGCVGGRHRSVALAEDIALTLRAQGIGVEVEHRDIDKPVIQP